MARPSTYSEEIADVVLDRLGNGESLRKICADNIMPDRSTVMRWCDQDATFRDRYDRARQMGEDWLFAELREEAEAAIKIADDAQHDWVDRKNGRGDIERVADLDHINRSKLRVEARQKRITTLQWQLSKLNPGKYGDRQLIEADISADVKVERTELSDFENAKRLAFLLQKCGIDILPAGMKAVPIEATVINPGERDDTPRQLAPAQLRRLGLLPPPEPQANTQFIEGNAATSTGFVNGAIG